MVKGACSEKGSHPILNVLTGRKQVISKEKYHHEEHEGHKVKSGYKNFVIFVYFVVDKFYNLLQEPSLPLRAGPLGFL